jgi:hypothetical protein
MQQRTGEALDSLDGLRRLQPDAPDTRNAERVVRTVLSSTIDAGASFYSDSDRLQIQRLEPRASIAIRTGTRVSAGYGGTILEARPGTGLEQVNGSGSAEYRHGWAGASQKLGAVVLGGRVGFAEAERHELTTYAFRAELYPTDGVRLAAQRSSDFFVISPRTVGLGLQETAHRIEVDLMAGLRDQVVFEASHRELSDGNVRWEIAFSPRHAIARTSWLNFDLGASAYVLNTKHDFDHGYYDPRWYEHYAVVASPYFKFQEEIGLGLSVAAGAQRDRDAGGFDFGGSASGEATFGIYRRWVLKVAGSAMLNRRLASGAYRGVGGTIGLVRRF